MNLCLSKRHSGINVTDDKGAKAYLKQSGYIAFSQSHNGMVQVIVSLPYIEGITERSDGKLLASVAPGDITADLVDNYVEQFFDLLTTWETGK